MTVPPIRAVSPDPYYVHALRRQVLAETCSDLAKDSRDDLITVLRERLIADLGHTATEVTVVLLAAAWRDADLLNGHVCAVYGRQVAADQHDTTSGHDVCCGGECACAFGPRYDRNRCDDCNIGPHALVDDALRELLWFLTGTVSERACVEMAGGR